MSNKLKYDLRGVSATKEDVHKAIIGLDKGLYPNAFCKVIPDVVAGDEDYCNIMHADTAGTKTSLAYMYWKETGNLEVWRGIARDAMVMNFDDMGCIGCIDNIVLSSTIGRNKNLISGDVIKILIDETVAFTEKLRSLGVSITLAGGETADVGDVVRTIDVGYTAFARMKRSDVLENDIQDGDVIVGLSSFGQATYEDTYNGGMGCNGLTSARHDVLNFYYAEEYPESFDPKTPESVIYMGMRRLTDEVSVGGKGFDVGQLLLSPTRTYLPVLSRLMKEKQLNIHGIIHNTGGGQTKVLNFVENKHIIKDNLFEIPTLFSLIMEQSDTSLKEMYQVFNMGHRLEVYLPKEEAQAVIDIANSFNIEAQIVGRVESSDSGNKLTLKTNNEILEY